MTRDGTMGGLSLFLMILVLYGMKALSGSLAPDTRTGAEGVFVEIAGEVARPGVYGFRNPPSLMSVLARSGTSESRLLDQARDRRRICPGGTRIHVRRSGGRTVVHEGRMQAFYKTTLGIPLSLNAESWVGLTSLPGIGPGLARRIVRERAERGGFSRVEEILSVPGMGPRLYGRSSPHLVL